MIDIKGRHVCENCFEEIDTPACPHCGYAPGESAVDHSMLTPGSTLFEKYVVGQVIGKGGFGITYLAYDADKDRKVAIKEYFPYGIARRSDSGPKVSVTSGENAETFELGAEKFYEEAKLVSKFNGSPNIVEVYEFFYENDTVYLVMEYLHGITLKEYIRDHGIISAPQALYIVRCVSAALSSAHAASVLHRDISPDNIILCDNGNVKLIDFGSARQLVAEHSQSFSVILKPGFAPPEQYQKNGNQGPWTDIYSLGATLYFALTGDIPEDPVSRFDEDDTFKSNQFDIAPELWEIISKATKLKAEDRYADIEEMENELNKVSFEPLPIIKPPADPDAELLTGAPLGLSRMSAPQNYKQHMSFTTKSEEKGFFAAHKAAVITVGCLAVIAAAAIIISIILNKPETASGSSSDLPESSGISDSLPVSDTSSDSETSVPDPTEALFNIPDYKTKVYYTTLNDEDKQLYEKIYNCIDNATVKLEFPEMIPHGILSEVYFKVLYDNPQFCYVQDFTAMFYDLNKNNLVDPNEDVEEIRPYYFTDDNRKAKNNMLSTLNECDPDGDMVENLRLVHDKLAKTVRAVERYADATCTSAYGPIVVKSGDDMGFAKAFCFYAQALGLQCYVVDGKFGDDLRAWCRVELDGTWYNVDVYGDKLCKEQVTKMEVQYTGESFHTFFLVNDEYIKDAGYVHNSEYDPLWEGEYAADHPESSYFFQNEENFLYGDPEAAYEVVLELTAASFAAESYSTSICTAPSIVDGLYDIINGRLAADLEEKYGIKPSGIDMEYSPDKFAVILTP